MLREHPIKSRARALLCLQSRMAPDVSLLFIRNGLTDQQSGASRISEEQNPTGAAHAAFFAIRWNPVTPVSRAPQLGDVSPELGLSTRPRALSPRERRMTKASPDLGNDTCYCKLQTRKPAVEVATKAQTLMLVRSEIGFPECYDFPHMLPVSSLIVPACLCGHVCVRAHIH